MSKVIAGIFTIVGGLLTLYFTFVMANSSYNLEYNDPKLHMSMFQTGHMVPLVLGILLLTVGLTFFFVAKESNPNIKG
jgi:low temperature requirement protein LtrA